MTESNRTELRVKRGPDTPPGNFYRESYLRFPLGGVDGTVIGATLRLHSTQSPGVPVAIARTGGQWEESTITYANRPVSEASFAQWVPVAGEAASVDVGAQVVAARAAGDAAISFQKTAVADDNTTIQFASSHHPEASFRPELVLTLLPTVGGSAGAGVDYAGLCGSATFAADPVAITVPVVPVPNDRVQGDRTVVLRLHGGAEYGVGANLEATVRIRDKPYDRWLGQLGFADREEAETAAGNASGLSPLIHYALGVPPAEPVAARLPRLLETPDGNGPTSRAFTFERPWSKSTRRSVDAPAPAVASVCDCR
jgi:hypothetical protein